MHLKSNSSINSFNFTPQTSNFFNNSSINNTSDEFLAIRKLSFKDNPGRFTDIKKNHENLLKEKYNYN